MAHANLIGIHGADVVRAIHDDLVSVLARDSLDGVNDVADQSRNRETFEDEVHFSGLDLGQIENIVDQRQKMAGRTLDTIERLDLIVAFEFARILLQHFGYADDGIEWRAQFVRHVGEKAGFRAACLLRGVARNLKLMHKAGKFRFPLLEFGNVRVGGDNTAVCGPPLVDVDPTAIAAVLNVRATGGFVLGNPFRQPSLVAPRRHGRSSRARRQFE